MIRSVAPGLILQFDIYKINSYLMPNSINLTALIFVYCPAYQNQSSVQLCCKYSQLNKCHMYVYCIPMTCRNSYLTDIKHFLFKYSPRPI